MLLAGGGGANEGGAGSAEAARRTVSPALLQSQIFGIAHLVLVFARADHSAQSDEFMLLHRSQPGQDALQRIRPMVRPRAHFAVLCVLLLFPSHLLYGDQGLPLREIVVVGFSGCRFTGCLSQGIRMVET